MEQSPEADKEMINVYDALSIVFGRAWRDNVTLYSNQAIFLAQWLKQSIRWVKRMALIYDPKVWTIPSTLPRDIAVTIIEMSIDCLAIISIKEKFELDRLMTRNFQASLDKQGECQYSTDLSQRTVLSQPTDISLEATRPFATPTIAVEDDDDNKEQGMRANDVELAELREEKEKWKQEKQSLEENVQSLTHDNNRWVYKYLCLDPRLGYGIGRGVYESIIRPS